MDPYMEHLLKVWNSRLGPGCTGSWELIVTFSGILRANGEAQPLLNFINLQLNTLYEKQGTLYSKLINFSLFYYILLLTMLSRLSLYIFVVEIP